MVTAQQAAAGVPPVGMAFLDAIAKSESAGRYDVGYGGSRIADLSRHPGKYTTILSGPNKGQKSSAAGRYQFLERTWNQYAAKLGLKDFSPKSQDRAAWELAKDTYKAKTGGDLQSDLESGDPKAAAKAASALSGVWTSLPKGIEQGQSSKQFAANYAAALPNHQQAPFDRGGLLSPNPGGLMGAVAAPVPDSEKGKIAAGYQQMANSLGDAGVKSLGGGLLANAPASSMAGEIGARTPSASGLLGGSIPQVNASATARTDPANPQVTASAAIPQPAPAPAVRAIDRVAPQQMPAPVMPPAPPPPVTQPQAMAAQSAQAFGPPMATGLDVWSGRAPVGMANNGNVLSERGGNIYSYNPTYDRTSIFNASGDVVGSFKGQQQNGLFGSDFGGFGDKLGGMLSGRNSQFGDKARAVTGAVAGGLLGNYVGGPLGASIGAALGKEIAAGRNPFDGGLRGLFSAATGNGSFPSAPPAPAQTTGPGLGTALSPQAQAAINAAPGGLY